MHYILFTTSVYRKEIVEKSTNKWIMAALKVHQKHKEGKEDHNFPRDHAVHFCVPTGPAHSGDSLFEENILVHVLLYNTPWLTLLLVLGKTCVNQNLC